MRKAHLRFWGDERGEHGMPKPYYAYQVFASDMDMPPVKAIASTLGFTEGTQENRHVTSIIDEDDAFDKAVASLKALPRHAGLKFDVTDL